MRRKTTLRWIDSEITLYLEALTDGTPKRVGDVRDLQTRIRRLEAEREAVLLAPGALQRLAAGLRSLPARIRRMVLTGCFRRA